MGVMDERSSRIFVGVCLLVLLWIGTYWIYEPGRPASTADVSFDTPEPDTPTITVDPVDTPAVELEKDEVSESAADTEAEALPLPEPAPGTRVIPPEFREYIVKSGDTLETIARDQLGRSSLWTAIAESNPLKDPRRLRVGQTLRIPVDPDNIQGRVIADSDTGDGEAAEDAEPAATWVEYTVRSGDSLTRIARSYYGSVRYADAIFEANRDRLDSPDAISVGQVLRLPPLGDAEE